MKMIMLEMIQKLKFDCLSANVDVIVGDAREVHDAKVSEY